DRGDLEGGARREGPRRDGLAETTPRQAERAHRGGGDDGDACGGGLGVSPIVNARHGAALTSRLTLAPPKAKALASAARTGRRSALPVTWGSAQSGSGARRPAVGSTTPRSTAWSAHSRPRAPAPAMAWPRAPFTELTRAPPRSGPSTRRRAAASMASFWTVEVP